MNKAVLILMTIFVVSIIAQSAIATETLTTDKEVYSPSTSTLNRSIIQVTYVTDNSSYQNVWDITINVTAYHAEDLSFNISYLNSTNETQYATDLNISTISDYSLTLLSTNPNLFNITAYASTPNASRVTITIGFNGSDEIAPVNMTEDFYLEWVELTGTYAHNSQMAKNGSNFTFELIAINDSSQDCILYVNSIATGNISAVNMTETGIITNWTTDGTYNYWIECLNDEVNENITSPVKVAFFDSTAPTMYVNDSISNQSYITNPQYDVVFNVTDNNYTSLNCAVFLNGVINETNSSVTTSTETTFSITGLEEASYSWYLNCSDGLSNTNVSEIYVFTYDVTIPNVSASEISAREAGLLTTLIINLTINDTNNLISVLANDVSMTFWESMNWTLSTTPTALGCTETGNCTITFNATDPAGNFNDSETQWVIVDATAPVIIVNDTVINLTNQSGQNYSVVFNYTDNLYSNINCSILLDGIINVSNASTFNDTETVLELTYLSEGLHNFIIECTDTMSNKGSSGNYTLRRDNTSPTLTIDSVSDNITKSTTELRIIANATDSLDISGVNLLNLSMTQIGTSESYDVNFTPIEIGCSVEENCWINITANDTIPNTRTIDTNITIDDTAPAGSAVAYSDRNVTSTASIVINVTITETNNVSSVLLNDNVTMTFAEGSVWSATTTATALGCSEGTCSGIINITDNADNFDASTTFSFDVDDTAPTVTAIAPTADANTTNTSIEWLYSINDTQSLRFNCTLYLSGVANTSNSSAFNYTLETSSRFNYSGLADGTYSGSVYCTDEAGNTGGNTSFGAITIDTAGPTITHNYPAANENISDTTPTIIVTIADPGVGVNISAVNISINGTVYNSTNLSCTGTSASYTCSQAVTIDPQDFNLWVNVSAYDFIGTQTTSNAEFGINIVAPTYDNTYTAQTAAENMTSTNNETYNFTADIWTNATLLGNLTWIGEDTLNITDDNYTINISINGTSYVMNYTGHNESYDYNFTTNISDVCDFINENVSATVCFNSSDRFFFNLTGDNATLIIGESTWNTWLGIEADNFSRNQRLRGNHTFNFSIDGTAYSVTFNVTNGTNTTADDVLEAIVAEGATAELNSSENIILYSGTTGNQSVISIGTETGTNAILGFTDSLSTSGIRGHYDYIGVDDYAVQSGTRVWFYVYNWTDDVALDKVWVQKNGSATKYNITNVRGFEWNQTNISVDITESDVGLLYLVMYANDTYGNVNYTPQINITVSDNLAPVIQIASPANASNISNSYFNVTFNVTEATPRTAFCNWTLANASGAVLTGSKTSSGYNSISGSTRTYIIEMNAINESEYTWTVQCFQNDNLNTSNTINFNLTDTTAPQIYTATPAGEQSTTETSLDVTLSVTTDEAATCKYDTVNVTYANLNSSLTAGGGGKTHTATISYTEDDTSEIFYVLCNDTEGNVMSTANTEVISYSVDVGTETTPAGSSPVLFKGGGGGAPATTRQVSYSHTYAEIPEGADVTVKIDKDNIIVTGVQFETLAKLEDATIKVEMLSGKPSITTAIEGSNTYKYLSLNKQNIKDEQIENIKVKFRVEKSWLSANAVNKKDIRLFRWTDAWNELSTRILSEDDSYVSYTAEVPGFSYFMVAQTLGSLTEEETAPVAEEPPVVETPPEVPPTPPQEKEPEAEPSIEPPKGRSSAVYVIIGVILLGLLALVVFLMRKGKRGQEKLAVPDLPEPQEQAAEDTQRPEEPIEPPK